jgi:tRNA threonylcarbamoyl adenosine modification protein YjeE
MTSSFLFPDLTEDDISRLAEEMAFLLQPGDTLTLEGDLGAGKSTFARALIRTLSLDPALDVPSPTFTLTQTYETPRFEVAHFDLYRLDEPDELDELGLEAALTRGAAIVEWASRAGDRIPADRFTLSLEDTSSSDTRNVTVSASPTLAPRLRRFAATRKFLSNAGWGDPSTHFHYLQGDASPRRYGRLTKANGTRALLMDCARRPDGPPIKDGKPYSAIAHLAEDVRAFVAIGGALREAGFSTPRILAEDLNEGFLLTEDFGNLVFASEVARGAEQSPLWRRATDVLLALHEKPPPSRMTLSDGSTFELSAADTSIFEIETELLLDWYWPAVHGAAAPQSARDDFTSEWRKVFERILRQPKTWLLRDYHSPNLIALDDRPRPKDVGIIDFQDALIGPAAYDLVSLLQDARVDVDEALEQQLFQYYVTQVSKRDPTFDANEFGFAYAALGAQRNTKILGIFARLAMRDGKRQYLAHLPRIWKYLERDLKHEDLRALGAWYDRNLPRDLRTQALRV